MTSEVSICNRALTLLGDELIIALTDDNNRGRCMNANYAPIRDAELARRRWRFSIARTSLPALAAVPDSDYTKQYQLPNDFLSLIEGGDLVGRADLTDYRSASNAPWSREGRVILTDLGSPLHIRYIKQVTDASMFDPAFAESLAARIADECCERITQSDSKRQLCMSAYSRAIKEAARANAIEIPAESQTDGEWVMARRG